jgi:hypothetical protein
MLPKMFRKHCGITAEDEKVLKTPSTDWEATENIAPRHLSEAIQYRTLDRSY